MIRISYAVTISNEFDESMALLNRLLAYKGDEAEIVVLLDTPKASQELLQYLEILGSSDQITLLKSEFKNDFSQWKNTLNNYCTGEWIFQLDADENLTPELLVNMIDILNSNDNQDLIFIPRINYVKGITEDHIKKWGWVLNEKGQINFPDFQSRLYKRKPEIFWVNKVHEQITGFKTYTNFPLEEMYCIQHIKDIKRQEKQNDYYSTL